MIELDTSHFKGNAPGWATVSCVDSSGGETEPLSRERLQPDTRHLFRVTGEHEATEVRLDVYPDGGMARLRLYGSLTEEGRRQLVYRWADQLPPSQADMINAESLVNGLVELVSCGA
jgi:allantoicase